MKQSTGFPFANESGVSMARRQAIITYSDPEDYRPEPQRPAPIVGNEALDRLERLVARGRWTGRLLVRLAAIAAIAGLAYCSSSLAARLLELAA